MAHAYRTHKLYLYSFLAFLALTACIAISSVVYGHFSDFEIRTLMTTATISVASLCSLCCSTCRRRQHLFPVVIIGIGLAIASALLLIIGVWLTENSGMYWKTTLILCVFTVAIAQALALLSIPMQTNYQWTRILTLSSIFILALMICAVIGSNGDALEDIYKPIVVFSILAALGTLTVLILSQVTKSPPLVEAADNACPLSKRADGLYEDSEGNLYKLVS